MANTKDFNKALEIGRPSNVVKLFTNSKALNVSGKGRPMMKKGKTMTTSKNDNDIAVVIMPFNEEMRFVYEDHIRKVIKSFEMNAIRADDIYSNQEILKDIKEVIKNAKLIIADCSSQNGNVCYEIGLAHAFERETILISQSLNDVPSDLRHIRTILYNNSPRGMSLFETKLKKL